MAEIVARRAAAKLLLLFLFFYFFLLENNDFFFTKKKEKKSFQSAVIGWPADTKMRGRAHRFVAGFLVAALRSVE